MDEKDLLNLKENINDAKNEVNQLEGRKKYLMQQLEDDWGCKSLKQAKKKLENFQSEIKELEQKIKDGVETLEETYEFD